MYFQQVVSGARPLSAAPPGVADAPQHDFGEKFQPGEPDSPTSAPPTERAVDTAAPEPVPVAAQARDASTSPLQAARLSPTPSSLGTSEDSVVGARIYLGEMFQATLPPVGAADSDDKSELVWSPDCLDGASYRCTHSLTPLNIGSRGKISV